MTYLITKDGPTVFWPVVEFYCEGMARANPRKNSKSITMNPIHLINNSRQVQSRSLPEYVRLPRPGQRCFYTGLSRTTLFELCVPCSRNGFRPPIRSYQLRSKGAERGIRLLRLNDLFEHIESHAVVIVSQENNNPDSR